jgi:predicted ArsR family transcriptional regulator
VDVTPFPAHSPAAKIVDYLQRHGEATVKELEELLGVSTTAVREHLTNLQARALLDTRLQRKGQGRPRLVYYLTPAARNLIPKSYDTLVTLLIREIASRGGADQLQILLDAVGDRMAESYRHRVVGDDVPQRLETLRELMEARGIPTEIQLADETLQVFACPYHDAAREHSAVCTMEQRMFEQLIGEQITLEGTIREGKRCCQFRVTNRIDETSVK